MPSRGSPIVTYSCKPKFEEANGITADAESEHARTTKAPADRKPDRATLGFSFGMSDSGKS